MALDVDPSRIKDVALQELDWVCHYLFAHQFKTKGNILHTCKGYTYHLWFPFRQYYGSIYKSLSLANVGGAPE